MAKSKETGSSGPTIGAPDSTDGAKQEGIDAMKEYRALTEKLLLIGKSGDAKELQKFIKKLLKSGDFETASDIVKGFRDSNKRTVIHFAAAEGHFKVVQYIVESVDKESVTWTDGDGSTALHFAVSGERLDLVSYLIENGADVHATRSSGTKPVHLAAQTGNIKLLQILMSNGVSVVSDIDSDVGTPLHWAVRDGHPEMVQFLLAEGTPVNRPNRSASPVAPLAMATIMGRAQIVKILIEGGADITATVAGNLNPLHMAAEVGLKETVMELLKADADAVQKALHTKSEEGEMLPVQLAAVEGHINIVDLLLPLTVLEESTTASELVKKQGEAARMAQEGKTTDAQKQEEVPLPLAPSDEESLSQAQQAKNKGNQLFVQKKFEDALVAYTSAIELNPADYVFYGNRCACYLELHRPEEALKDISVCKRLQPNWAKAYFREGKAFEALKQYEDAAYAYWEAVKLEPKNKALNESFQRAIKLGQDHHAAKKS